MLSLYGLLASVVVGAMATDWIVPGEAWYDTNGKKIDAHGGGIVRRQDVFYWVGFSASNQTPMIYSSSDLLNWKNLGSQAPSVTGFWRPKIASPGNAESYWLFGQQDRYVLSLHSSKFLGGYQASAKIHLPPNNYTYSDTGMFHDEETDIWYLLTSADHNTIQINEIDKDGNVGKQVSTLTGGAYEAPGIFKANDTYFLIVSGKTGWRSNPNKVFWANTLSGPWKGGTDIAPAEKKTYDSQNTFELVIQGTQQTTYIYMGDSWDARGGASSNYTWLPMAVDSRAKTVTLQGYTKWRVDVKTGVVTSSN